MKIHERRFGRGKQVVVACLGHRWGFYRRRKGKPWRFHVRNEPDAWFWYCGPFAGWVA